VATGPRKKFDDIFSRLNTLHERDGQTDGHRPTAKTALMHSAVINDAQCIRILSRATLCVSAAFAIGRCPLLCTYGVRLFPPSGRGLILVYWALPPLNRPISRGTHIAGAFPALNIRGWKIFAIIDRNRRLSWKRYETGPWLLWMKS